MAAGGYPGSYDKGMAISGLEQADSPVCKVFHAGTRSEGDTVCTSGGRVLCVTALGDSISAAQQTAYAAVEGIDWDGAFYRRDIAWRAIERENG